MGGSRRHLGDLQQTKSLKIKDMMKIGSGGDSFSGSSLFLLLYPNQQYTIIPNTNHQSIHRSLAQLILSLQSIAKTA